MRIYLCGQKFFGQEVLRLLLSLGHDVAGVSAPAWKNEKLSLAQGDDNQVPDRLRAVAQAEGIAWLEAGKLDAASLPEGVDLIVAAHSHDFIGARTRGKSRLGAIGYHPSLLPLHRGRDAIRWAVKLHERVTGGTVFWLSDVVDGGPVAAQEWCFVRPQDTAEELWRRELQPMGLRLITKVLADLDRGLVVAVPQDPALATWEPGLDPPRMHRPDLLRLGDNRNGWQVTADPEQLKRDYGELRLALYSGGKSG